MIETLDIFGEIYKALADNIFLFCRAMNFEPTWQQSQLLICVQRGDKQIACRSGKGPGKTTVCAIVGLWRTFRKFMSMTVLTAPTMRQCTEVWLSEARRLLDKADDWLKRFINITRTKVTMGGCDEWKVVAVTAVKGNNAFGYHHPNLTVIGEEASGIPSPIMQAFKDTLSNPDSMMLLIGNPNTRSCSFFDCFHKDAKYWTKLHWNGEETPESEWFTKDRNYRIEAEFGRDSDVYRIAVLGEFPHTDPNCVMSDIDVRACMNRELIVPCSAMSTVKQFGLDFARYGGDENTVYRRSGEAIVEAKQLQNADPSEAVQLAYDMQLKAGWRNEDVWFVPDAGGIGQGVMSQFYNAKKRVFEFNFGGSPKKVDKYKNRVTEAYFELAEKVKNKKCALPVDERLVQQLTTRRYFVNKMGLLVLEEKPDYEKRGFDSPDRGDGCVLAMYDHKSSSTRTSGVQSGRQRIGSSLHSNN